jgi:hypothetical protein
MPAKTDDERDAFLSEVRLGNIAVNRLGTGPLLAPTCRPARASPRPPRGS